MLLVLSCFFNFSSVYDLKVYQQDPKNFYAIVTAEHGRKFRAAVSSASVAEQRYQIITPKGSTLFLARGKGGWFLREVSGSFQESGLVDCK